MTKRIWKVLITGSRHWQAVEPIRNAIEKELSRAKSMNGNTLLLVIHGDCETGADAIAENVCKIMGLLTCRVAARWKQDGLVAGPIRNTAMVWLDPDVAYAFPLPDSKGTIDCITKAARAGIETPNWKPMTDHD